MTGIAQPRQLSLTRSAEIPMVLTRLATEDAGGGEKAILDKIHPLVNHHIVPG
jgi:hypothetical protein